MNSIRELMAIYGYKYTGICNCSGYRTLKYKKDDYEFRWRIHKYTFRLTLRGSTIKLWAPVKEAESYLKSIHEA